MAADRKWKATKAVLMLEFTASVAGIAKFVFSKDATMAGAATSFSLACFAAIAGTLAFYFTANVASKNVIGKNYQPDLANK